MGRTVGEDASVSGARGREGGREERPREEIDERKP